MKHTSWRSFIMYGLMIGGIILIGVGVLGIIFFFSADVGTEIPTRGSWPGMWGMGPFGMIFPCFGLVMIFFFFRMIMGGGGPMSGMMGRRGGPMSWMMGHSPGSQSQSRVSRDKPQGTCPSCGSPIEVDWKTCPHCGYQLTAA